MGLSGRKFKKEGDSATGVYALFAYSTKHLSSSDKVRFYYALKGRNGISGFLARTNSKHLAKSVILTPIEHDKEAIEFLTYWKCKFERRKVRLLNEED